MAGLLECYAYRPQNNYQSKSTRMEDRVLQFLTRLSEIVRPFVLPKGDGLKYAWRLALIYISLQGIRLVSSWVSVEISLLGVESIPGAIVVSIVCLGLIVAHCIQARFTATQAEMFREVLRLRELGFTLKEVEEKLSHYRLWVADLFASAEQHSIPIPVRYWSGGKLRSLIGSPEFAELVARSLPDLRGVEAFFGTLFLKWITDPSFREGFESTSDLIVWIANQQHGEAT
jgi:hypothetical protein